MSVASAVTSETKEKLAYFYFELDSDEVLLNSTLKERRNRPMSVGGRYIVACAKYEVDENGLIKDFPWIEFGASVFRKDTNEEHWTKHNHDSHKHTAKQRMLKCPMRVYYAHSRHGCKYDEGELNYINNLEVRSNFEKKIKKTQHQIEQINSQLYLLPDTLQNAQLRLQLLDQLKLKKDKLTEQKKIVESGNCEKQLLDMILISKKKEEYLNCIKWVVYRSIRPGIEKPEKGVYDVKGDRKKKNVILQLPVHLPRQIIRMSEPLLRNSADDFETTKEDPFETTKDNDIDYEDIVNRERPSIFTNNE